MEALELVPNRSIVFEIALEPTGDPLFRDFASIFVFEENVSVLYARRARAYSRRTLIPLAISSRQLNVSLVCSR